jgi:regulator of replication initiation timing
MVSFNSIVDFIFGKKNKLVHIQIDPDSIETNHQVKALAYENAELKGEISKLRNYVGKIKGRDEDKLEEENVKASLNEQKNEIKLISQGKVFSLRKFYGRYFRDKKFRESLGIYSFDRSTKLADYGDFGITDNGDFALSDKNGNIILRMGKLKDMMQSVGALGNDISKGMIPVNLDKEGGYIENIMVYEAPELINTGENLRFAKARKKPVYEIIRIK